MKWWTTFLFLSIFDSFTNGYSRLLLFINKNVVLMLSPIFDLIHDTRLIRGCLFGWTITIHVSQFEPYVYSPISEQLQILVSNRTSSNLWWSCSYAKPPIALFSLKTSHTDSLKYKKNVEIKWQFESDCTHWIWYLYNYEDLPKMAKTKNGVSSRCFLVENDLDWIHQRRHPKFLFSVDIK